MPLRADRPWDSSDRAEVLRAFASLWVPPYVRTFQRFTISIRGICCSYDPLPQPLLIGFDRTPATDRAL